MCCTCAGEIAPVNVRACGPVCVRASVTMSRCVRAHECVCVCAGKGVCVCIHVMCVRAYACLHV